MLNVVILFAGVRLNPRFDGKVSQRIKTAPLSIALAALELYETVYYARGDCS
jgi:hypothetical protein